MYKKLPILCFILVLFSVKLYSQALNTIRDSLNYKYSSLNSSEFINTDYLYDKAASAFDLSGFNGEINSDTCNLNIIKQLIWQHEFAFIRENRDGIDGVKQVELKASTYVGTNINPIVLMVNKYNYITQTAIDEGLIYLNQNMQLVESNNISQSAYGEIQMCAASLLTNYLNNNKFKFIIDPELIINNTGIDIDRIDIDLGDGFNQIQFNEVYEFDFSGEIGKIICILKITLNDNTILFANFNFNYTDANSTFVEPDFDSELIISNIPFNPPVCATINTGLYGKARFYIKYAKNNVSHQLIKPLIFVEGFDPEKSYDPIHHRYGEIGWDVFTSGGFTFDGENKFPNLSELPNLLDLLRSSNNDYDIVYVDFENGGDYIQKNGYALIKVIQELNSIKIGNEESVIIGTSMGGLISRFALSYMEKNNLPHCTRLWVSFDSPHNGANIPIGLQAGVNFFANFNAEAYEGMNQLNSPASLQMLLKHLGEVRQYPVINAVCYRDNLVNVLNQLGFPEIPRKIALLNGSPTSNGVDNFGYSQDICNMKYSLLSKTLLQFNVNTQPQNVGTIFLGVYSIRERLFFTTIRNNRIFTCLNNDCINYDGAPGGTNNTTGKFYQKSIEGLYIEEGKRPTFEYLRNSGATTFIPTFSSIALYNNVSVNPFYDIVSNINSEYTTQAKTPFEAYAFDLNNSTTQGVNNPHVTPTSSNTTWLLNQLEYNSYKLPTALPNSYGSTFNISASYQRKIKSIEVNNTGLLQINGNYKNFYGSNTDLNARVGSTIVIYSTECLSNNININNGGKLVLGDNGSSSNKAILYLMNGTTLRIRNNAELIIYNNSKLIINAGAKLIIEAGAIINLDGLNSLIESAGTIEIESNASFSKIGNGYFKFKGNNAESLKLGINSKFVFSGTGKTDKIIEVENGAATITSESGSEFLISNAHINYTNGSLIVKSKLVLLNVKSDGSGMGLIASGNNVVNITDCEFSGTIRGLELFYSSSSGTSATIYNSTFSSHPAYDIKTYGRAFSIDNCVFSDSHTPIYAQQISDNSSIESCYFGNFPDTAIYLNGTSVPTITCNNIKIGNVSQYFSIKEALVAINCIVTLSCSEIYSKENAIHLGLNASLDISNDNISTFGNNIISKVPNDDEDKTALIILSGASQLYMRNGFNTLKKNVSTTNSTTTSFFIQGGLVPYFQTIDATNNFWFADMYSDNGFPNSNSQIDFGIFKTSIDFDPIAEVGDYDNPCLMSNRLMADPCTDPNNCPTSSNILNNCSECNTVNFKGKSINKYLKKIIKEIRLDTLKINTVQHLMSLDSLLNVNFFGNKPKVDLVKDRALHLLLKQYSLIQNDATYASAKPFALNKIRATLNHRLARAINKDDTARIVQVHLIKAHLFLSENLHSQAINQFDNALNYFEINSEEYQTIQMQKCLVSIEDLFENGLINDSVRIQMMFSCETTQTISSRSLQIQNSSPQLPTLDTRYVKINPNPANDWLNVEFVNFSNNEAEITVYDLIGRIVLEKNLSLQGDGNNESTQLDISNLMQGTYIVKIKSNDFVKMHKQMKD